MKKQNESKLAAFFGITRASRAIALSGVAVILLLAVLIAVNVVVGQLPQTLVKPDVTGKETFLISGKTLDWLGTLDEDVTLYLICNGGRSMADGDLLAFLSRYEDASRHVEVEVIDSSSDTAFIEAHGGVWPSELSVIVESAARYKIIDNTELYFYYFYDTSYGGMRMTPMEYAAMLDTFSKNDTTGESLALFMKNTTPYFDGESCVTNAINYVTLDRVATVYTLTGNGTTALDAGLTEYLSDASFDVLSLSALTQIPTDCDVLLMNAPTVDLTEEEATALSAYLAGGGKLFLTTMFSATDLPKLASVLKGYGLGFTEKPNQIYEGNTNYLFNTSISKSIFFAHIDASHPIVSEHEGTVLVTTAHSIEFIGTEGVEHAKLLYTSTLGYICDLSEKKAQIGEKGEFVFGISAQKGNSEIIWISDSNLLSSQINTYSSNGNFDFALSALNHLSGVTSDSIAVEARVMETSTLSVSATQFIVLGVILVLILPITAAAIGIGIWYVRKKR